MALINKEKINKLKRLYFEKGRSMNDLAKHFDVSLDAIVYAMRKYNLPRRNKKEASMVLFNNKKPSFKRRNINLSNKVVSEAILASLYWGEGYKSDNAKVMDFANSDSEMIKVFLKYLRNLYDLEEKKFRILLYCYENQNQKELIHYWSETTKIPKTQFTKPYVKSDSGKNGRIMKHGLVHIRYGDKKLLKEIKNLIESLKV